MTLRIFLHNFKTKSRVDNSRCKTYFRVQTLPNECTHGRKTDFDHKKMKTT